MLLSLVSFCLMDHLYEVLCVLYFNFANVHPRYMPEINSFVRRKRRLVYCRKLQSSLKILLVQNCRIYCKTCSNFTILIFLNVSWKTSWHMFTGQERSRYTYCQERLRLHRTGRTPGSLEEGELGTWYVFQEQYSTWCI